MNQAFLIKNNILQKYQGEDKVVEIPEGIQAIGKKAFEDNKIITEVIMPDSVIEIGDGAFEECSKLRKVSLSKNLETIKESAFYKCRSLKSLELPKSVKKIEDSAFAACSKLETCTCATEDIEILGNPFSGLYSDGTCKMLYDKDGFLIFAGVLFGYEGTASTLVIPDTVKRIENGVFRRSVWENSNLKKVVIPDSVVEIGAGAFEDCNKLEEIIVPEHVVMGERVFAGCKKLANEQGFVILNGILYAYFGDREEVIIPEGVTKIGDRIFTTYYSSNPGNDNIKKVVLPESLCWIGSSAFAQCKNLESITIPEKVEHIGESAFVGCVGLKELYISPNLEDIGYQAFSRCKGLANEQGFVIVNGVLYDYFSSIRDVVIPEGVKEISDGVFDKSMIEKITLPSTLQKIGPAFRGCDRLVEITIPEGVSRIAASTFSKCLSLKIVNLPNSLKEICQYAFDDCQSLSEITLPESLVTIGTYAFKGCGALKSIKIPTNVKILERFVFQNCKQLKEVFVHDDMERIKDSAFWGCTSLEQMQIPKNMLEIEGDAFHDCTSLHELIYDDIKGKISIAAFDGCNALVDENGFLIISNILLKYVGEGGDIVVPEGVKEIAQNAFREGYRFQGRSRNVYRSEGSLTGLTLPKSLKIIHKNAIEGCIGLKTLILPEGLEVLGEEALCKCRKLETIVLPSTLKSIEKNVFTECEMLQKIEIPALVEHIGEDAFLGCATLHSIEVDTENTKYASVDGILYNKEKNTILFCPGGKNLLTYKIPEYVTTIVNHAFVNCVALKSLSIPASVQRVESYAFPKYNWTQKNVLKNIEIDVNAGKEYVGTDIFTFEYGEGPLAFPKMPVTFVKEQKTQLRLALNYCQHPEQYEGEWAKGYEAYVKSHQKSLLKLAIEQRLNVVLEYFAKLDEGNTENKKTQKVNYKKLSESQKVSLLEKTVIEGDISNLREVLENCKTFEFTARALGMACLFGNLEMVKLLVEHGATFYYELSPSFERKYNVTYGSSYSSYPANYSLMLVRNGVNATVPGLYVPAYTMHFASMPDFVFDETQENQRADIAEYLTQNAKKVGFYPMHVLYYAILWGLRPVVDRLLSLGVKLSGLAVNTITGTTLSVDRNEWLGTLQVLSAKQILSVLTTIYKCLEGTEYKIIFTQTNFENLKEKFSDSELLRFVLEKTDIGKLTKSKVMELVVETEQIAGLEWLAKAEWIKKPAQRDKWIQFAMDHQKNEALAWLIDYKNKTADILAEAQKKEAKMMRELMANPNSVTELKKIWTYKKLEDDTLMITSYKGSNLEIEVPSTIGKSQVSVIGEWAFSYVADRVKNEEVRKNITSVVLPEGITEIRKGAFIGCAQLQHITLPSTLKKMGENAFRNCEKLESVRIPEKIKEMDRTAFIGCTKMYDENGFLIVKDKFCDIRTKEIDIKIPDGPKQLLATNWERNMERITLPESVTIIGEDVFKNLHHLIRVEMGEHVHTIGTEAFYACCSLKEIVLPKGLKKIESKAFTYSGLREVKIPEGVEKIGPKAFEYCRDLVDVYIPASVKSIGKELFGVAVRGIYVHTPEGSYAETYFKSYVGVNIVHDEMYL